MKNTSFPSYPGEKLAFFVVVVVGEGGGGCVFRNLECKSPRKSRCGPLQPGLSLAGGQKLLLPQNKE